MASWKSYLLYFYWFDLGIFFPSCECGIVPIVHQFVKKAYQFTQRLLLCWLLRSSIQSWFFHFYRIWQFLADGKLAGDRQLLLPLWLVSGLPIFKRRCIERKITSKVAENHHHHVHEEEQSEKNEPKISWSIKLGMCWHIQSTNFWYRSLFDHWRINRSCDADLLPTRIMLTLGSTKILAIIIMLLLAFTMSLCSEADAFIGSSLLSLFGTAPVAAFLVFGPMVDIKIYWWWNDILQDALFYRWSDWLPLALLDSHYLFRRKICCGFDFIWVFRIDDVLASFWQTRSIYQCPLSLLSYSFNDFICSFGFSSAVFVGQKRKSRRKGTRARSWPWVVKTLSTWNRLCTASFAGNRGDVVSNS